MSSCAYMCSVCIDAIFFVLSISTSAHAHSPIRIVCIGKHTKAFQYGTTTNTKYVKYCSVLDVWWQPFVCLCCISVFCSQWNTQKKNIRSSSRAAKRKRKRRRQKEKKREKPLMATFLIKWVFVHESSACAVLCTKTKILLLFVSHIDFRLNACQKRILYLIDAIDIFDLWFVCGVNIIFRCEPNKFSLCSKPKKGTIKYNFHH